MCVCVCERVVVCERARVCVCVEWSWWVYNWRTTTGSSVFEFYTEFRAHFALIVNAVWSWGFRTDEGRGRVPLSNFFRSVYVVNSDACVRCNPNIHVRWLGSARRVYRLCV